MADAMEPDIFWSPLTKEARRLGLIGDTQMVRRTPGRGRYKRGYYLEEIGSFSVFVCRRRNEVIPCLRRRQARLAMAARDHRGSFDAAIAMIQQIRPKRRVPPGARPSRREGGA